MRTLLDAMLSVDFSQVQRDKIGLICCSCTLDNLIC